MQCWEHLLLPLLFHISVLLTYFKAGVHKSQVTKLCMFTVQLLLYTPPALIFKTPCICPPRDEHLASSLQMWAQSKLKCKTNLVKFHENTFRSYYLLPVGAVFGTFIAEESKGNQPATRADVPEWCSGRNRSDFKYWQIFRVLSQFALYIMGLVTLSCPLAPLPICKKPAQYRPTLPNFSRL